MRYRAEVEVLVKNIVSDQGSACRLLISMWDCLPEARWQGRWLFGWDFVNYLGARVKNRFHCGKRAREVFILDLAQHLRIFSM